MLRTVHEALNGVQSAGTMGSNTAVSYTMHGRAIHTGTNIVGGAGQ
jgi:hypothetical protein